MLQPMEDMVPPKHQAVVDRLRRRLECYRRRNSECVPRFDQSFAGACEQQNQETSALQKRFIEGKAKRQAKKSDRKPELPSISGNLHSSVHVQKFGCGEYEPPAKLQCGGAGGPGEALTKFSVEIVQQLEFTTSAADSQPQQISTNVTVKALTNAVKSSGSPPPPRAPTPLECKAECKSEAPDDDFVDLDECAAALERDAASAFPGLADLIGEEDGDEITSAAFEDLITEISEYPEFMKDFDLDGGKGGGGPELGYGGEMSPAAQTLKQMAEQHQQAAGEWARYRPYGAYRPRPPHASHAPHAAHPAHDHLHLSQAQQLHVSQPHHNLQVSAGQHMAVSGDLRGHVSVAAQQGMYASFAQPGAHSPHQPHPAHPAHASHPAHSAHPAHPSHQQHQHQGGGGGCDSYTVSQSQTINFTQQALRARQPAPAQPSAAPPPGSVAAAGMSREQHAKILQQQQQQMLRAQQHLRPPPPEYKAHARRMPGLGVRAPAPYPPHAHHVHAPHAPHTPHTPRQYPPEWRHVLMQQQTMRHPFAHHHQGGFNMGGLGSGGGMTVQQQQMQQLQQQQVRLQQQQMLQQQRAQNQQQSPMSHLAMQQSQMMSAQGQMGNIHMSQSQSVSLQSGMGGNSHSSPMQGQNGPMQGGGMHGQNGPMQGQNGPMHSQNGPMQGQNGPMQGQNGPMQGQNGPGQQHSSFPSLHNASSFPGQPADFNLDFLDSMPSSDASNLTAQELLNSLENSFLNDIL